VRQLSNKIICGDCIEVLSKVQSAGGGFAELIFADPPFNIGYKYDKYYDKVKRKNYIAWTEDWIKSCKRVLRPYGSFYIAIGDDYAADVKLIADRIGLVMRNWIIWHYTFGQQTKNKFARSHTHIFYFVNDKNNFTFNDHAIRVPSDRQLIYNDRRANSKGKIPDDVWSEYSRLCGTFKEREGWHPCQMPENLLARIITASSNPGDCVLDPFVGSGTTAAVAYQLGREYVGIEISESYVEKAEKRLEQIKKQTRIQSNLVLGSAELAELKRLCADIDKPIQNIISPDRKNRSKLLGILANQLSVRMNNGKKYQPEQIAAALGDLAV
jgi:DNA modification methylase